MVFEEGQHPSIFRNQLVVSDIFWSSPTFLFMQHVLQTNVNQRECSGCRRTNKLLWGNLWFKLGSCLLCSDPVTKCDCKLPLQASILYFRLSCCRPLNGYCGRVAVLSICTFEQGGLAVGQKVILFSSFVLGEAGGNCCLSSIGNLAASSYHGSSFWSEV